MVQIDSLSRGGGLVAFRAVEPAESSAVRSGDDDDMFAYVMSQHLSSLGYGQGMQYLSS
jgi:hypothetical protein